MIGERPLCQKFNDAVFQKLTTIKPDMVILSANWLNYEKRRALSSDDIVNRLGETIKSLRSIGAQVVVLGPTPVFPNKVPLIGLAKRGPAQAGMFTARYSKFFDRVFSDLAAKGDIRYFPVYALFCQNDDLCRFRDGETYYFWDEGHMTRAGADYVLGKIEPDLAAASAAAN